MLDSIANKSHPAELPGDEDSRNVGLKIRADIRNVHPALLRSEDKRDCIVRTYRLADPMTDTKAGFYEFSLAIDHSENSAIVGLRADQRAIAATQTFRDIDVRMQ